MADANRKIGLKLDIENIGPHNRDKSIHFSESVDSLKAIFYASNGIGKSFISRVFRLLSPDKNSSVPDDLLTLGQSTGSLQMEIAPTNEASKTISVSLQRGSDSAVQNDTGYLFHVFNSDYVEENIKPNEYTPDGDINGYILGKAQIDLTTERKQEAQLEAEINNKDADIDSTIQAAREELQANGIRQNQNEFSLISRDRLQDQQPVACSKSFDEIVFELAALEKLPDNIADITPPSLNADFSALDEVSAILLTAYPKSEWDDEFASTVKNKMTFIEKGLELAEGNNTCPFCEQPLGVDALDLIKRYKTFLSDKEAQTIRQIEGIASTIEQFTATLKDVTVKTELAYTKAMDVKKYFPSLKDISLSIPDTSSEHLSCFERVGSALKAKSENISDVTQNVDADLSKCKLIIDEVKKTCASNNETARRINEQKNNSSQERLNLRRELCYAQCTRTKTKLATDFKLRADKSYELDKLKASIKTKEEQERVSKKDKVYETLDYYLNRFFAGKYTIDKDTFCIQFLGASHPKASSILSDGEKSIVAFCFYLASTHLLMERDDDYNKLFFIIDDPISSMDFNFVYTVAQSLRDIKEYFGVERIRMFVLTHNLEFFSIISRNHTISQAYVMKPGKIEPLKKQLLMPYESHLFDIARIAKGQDKPSHTTSNSIRHVLETVSKFEYPERNLEKYISQSDTLKDNSCIFSLCQDLSHGAMRSQPPFDEQVLTEACKVVIAFMEQKYHGQIEAINGGKANNADVNDVTDGGTQR